jgi:hypothetical protein
MGFSLVGVWEVRREKRLKTALFSQLFEHFVNGPKNGLARLTRRVQRFP